MSLKKSPSVKLASFENFDFHIYFYIFHFKNIKIINFKLFFKIDDRDFQNSCV